MDLRKTKLNVNAVEEGVWIKVDKKTELLIARIGNSSNNNKLEALAAKHGSRTIARDEREDMYKRAMAGTVIKGWKGLIGEDGKELPYSEATAERLMTDKSQLEFQELVASLGQEKAAFRQEYVEEDASK